MLASIIALSFGLTD
ncbi:uncharacterized protein FFMR_03517 [Fusarium fujikuroi]|nr:uncharacterized protein FFC1_03168 [Fusarium fujikuroi]SCO34518.1 uncharacterized protein FFMR_03517 [Fusarium fujikuroi]SCO38496.1 uncharacterized protein FFNC_06263 [Fusarium fujikuroi]SCV50332.1 uncharacterized protein FFFS_09440 [Fusarium fujikuroi]SCV55424.1 uncharacterized protein FFFS_11751 [Fusarium fujikuroi]